MEGFASGANWGTTPNASVFTSSIESATRLATSAPFSRYLTEQIIENSAMIQSGLIPDRRSSEQCDGVLAELPFFDQLDYTGEPVDSSATGAKVATALSETLPSAPALSTVQL